MGILGRIRESLTRTKEQIVERFDEIVRRADEPARRSRAVDVETLDALEELLISADIGMAATDRIIGSVKKASRSGESLRDLVKAEICRVFESAEIPIAVTQPPRIVRMKRVCAEEGCETVLSCYNTRPMCWQHDPGGQYVLRVHDRRRERDSPRIYPAA